MLVSCKGRPHYRTMGWRVYPLKPIALFSVDSYLSGNVCGGLPDPQRESRSKLEHTDHWADVLRPSD